MKELLPFILFLVIVGGVNALRWLIEKQQREKEKEESARRGAEPPTQKPSVPRRPIFYGRPGERRPTAPTPHEAPTEARPPLRPVRPEPPHPAAPAAQRARRPAAPRDRQRTRRPAAAPALQPTEAAPQAQPLRAQAPKRSSLRKAPAAAPAIPKVAAAEPHLPTPFLGDLLAPKNLARAVVLAEILGPPKAFQDF